MKDKYTWWDVGKSVLMISIPILVWKLDTIILALKL